MRNVVLALLVGLPVAALLVGCGGGGSSSSNMTRGKARERAIATARLTRSTFSIAGFGKRITRAPGSSRLCLILGSLHGSRAVPPGFDTETGLYYTLTANMDGSGRQDLFTDAKDTKSAGGFTWTAPSWAGGVQNTYPAIIHIAYQMTGGTFSGDHGTIDFTAQDATGDNGTMHIVNTTKEKETSVADFTFVNGKITGKQNERFPDDTTCIEIDIPQPDDTMVCTVTFPDNSQEIMTMNMDGMTTEVLKGSNGTVDATGNLDSNGTDNITYSDGSQETVDVDTADAGDGGGSGDTSTDPSGG